MRSVEEDGTNHAPCSLTGALRLLSGKYIRVPKHAYPGWSPSRLARLLQVGNSARDLVLSAGRPRTLVSAEHLEYLSGNIDCFTEHILRHGWSLLGGKRPFFVVAGTHSSQLIASITGCDLTPAPRLCLTHHCVVVIMANWNGTPAVLHYAACDRGIAELRRLANGLGLASSDAQIRHLVPCLLAHTHLEDGAALLAQTRILADPSEFSWRRIDAATEMWLSRKPRSAFGGVAWVGQRMAQLGSLLPGFNDLLAPARDALLRWCETARIPQILMHGDFWLGNLLFSGDRISGIIDWEWAQEDGCASVDVLHMLLMSVADANGGRIAHYLRQFWADEISDPALRERIARLSLQSGMDTNDLKFMALLLWFGVLWQKALRGGAPSTSWLEDMIPRTMPAIDVWLCGHRKQAAGTQTTFI
jgi:hypothetical protein